MRKGAGTVNKLGPFTDIGWTVGGSFKTTIILTLETTRFNMKHKCVYVTDRRSMTEKYNLKNNAACSQTNTVHSYTRIHIVYLINGNTVNCFHCLHTCTVYYSTEYLKPNRIHNENINV